MTAALVVFTSLALSSASGIVFSNGRNAVSLARNINSFISQVRIRELYQLRSSNRRSDPYCQVVHLRYTVQARTRGLLHRSLRLRLHPSDLLISTYVQRYSNRQGFFAQPL